MSLFDESGEIERMAFGEIITVVFALVDCFVYGGEVIGHFLRYTSAMCEYSYPTRYVQGPYPTLTQHPPEMPASTIHVFCLYHPLARLAVPEPPLPPPMTIMSYCLGVGAMFRGVEES